MKIINNFKNISLLLICFLAISCSNNPVTHTKEWHVISKQQEIDLGEAHYQTAQNASGGIYNQSPEVSQYVERIGQKLARHSARPDLPFKFVILNQSTPNAWALPGGKIAITVGLLKALENEAQLAAVLAHEITHATARHGAKALERGLIIQSGLTLGAWYTSRDDIESALFLNGAQIASALIQQKYSRNAELEADHYGILTMVEAGYDPYAAVELQELFIKLMEAHRSSWIQGLFASHPPSIERAKANKALIMTLPKQHGLKNEKEYKTYINKLK